MLLFVCIANMFCCLYAKNTAVTFVSGPKRIIMRSLPVTFFFLSPRSVTARSDFSPSQSGGAYLLLCLFDDYRLNKMLCRTDGVHAP